MSSFGAAHKKGEHVFNDIAGSVENALNAALKSDRISSLLLTNRYGELSLDDLPQTNAAVEQLRKDQILAHARTIVGPATRIADDSNSKSYSLAKMNLQDALGNLVEHLGDLAWKRRPHSGSYHEFEGVVQGLRNTNSYKASAGAAMESLVEAAHDPFAEIGALSERTSDTELSRRRSAIEAMKQHRPALKETGRRILQAFFEEMEKIIDDRVGKA